MASGPARRRSYEFRPAVPADLPMLRQWRRRPEVVRWWGDPEEQPRCCGKILMSRAWSCGSCPSKAGHSPMRKTMRCMSGRSRISRIFLLGTRDRFLHWRARHDRLRSWLGVPEAAGERLRAEGAPVVARDPDENLRARRACQKAYEAWMSRIEPSHFRPDGLVRRSQSNGDRSRATESLNRMTVPRFRYSARSNSVHSARSRSKALSSSRAKRSS